MTPATSKSSKLIFCLAVYNAASILRDCLQSITPYADRIIIVEGRFAEHWRPVPTLHSTDSTLEIAREFTREIIVAGDLLQHKQRDLYLRGKPGDYYFVIDGDEVLEGVLPKKQILSGEYAVYAIWCRTAGKRDQLCLRIFKHYRGIHHSVGQCPLVTGDGVVMDASNFTVKRLTTCWLRHRKK